MELTDGRVSLRPPEDGDIAWIVRSCRDPENQRWLPLLPQPYGRADAEWWVNRCKRVWEDGSASPFIVIDAATLAPLGAIEVRIGDPAEIGYWLAPESRGRGAMTGALRLAVRYAFAERALPRVELFTLLDNERSQAVARRAGFRRDGLVVGKIESRDGTRHDAVRFVLEAAGSCGG